MFGSQKEFQVSVWRVPTAQEQLYVLMSLSRNTRDEIKWEPRL